MNAVLAPLLEEVLPEFDFRSRHNWLIEAPPEAVWWAVERYDLSRDASPLVRSLFHLRGLRVPRGPVRKAIVGAGFTGLAEQPGEEIVAGTTGRFWAFRERANMEAPADLGAFRTFDRPGWAKAAISIRVERREHGWSKLMTETRVQCVDDEARRRFTLYWGLINVFSGWIRRDMLRSIARIAESGP
jgi:hypothetical protein